MNDNVCAHFPFLSLLLVYLKSMKIVSAGIPEVKPAKAHTSYSVCYAEVVLRPLAACHPLFLVHLSCHCHQLSRLSYGVHAVLPSSFDLPSLLADDVLSFKAKPRKE